MRRRAGGTGHTATATSWADIAAQGAGGTRKGKKRWKKGNRGEFTQRGKKSSRRGRVKYTPTKRDHATREVEGCDTYLDRWRQAEVTPW